MPTSLQSSAIGSPASRRATNCSLSSVTEHSFQGISPSLKPGGSVTHVSGTKCHLCLRSLRATLKHICFVLVVCDVAAKAIAHRNREMGYAYLRLRQYEGAT